MCICLCPCVFQCECVWLSVNKVYSLHRLVSVLMNKIKSRNTASFNCRAKSIAFCISLSKTPPLSVFIMLTVSKNDCLINVNSRNVVDCNWLKLSKPFGQLLVVFERYNILKSSSSFYTGKVVWVHPSVRCCSWWRFISMPTRCKPLWIWCAPLLEWR